MTLREFQDSLEYRACTPKMQVWLTTLVESNFDYKTATATAFQCKNLRQAHTFSFAVRKWPVIRTALRLYLGLSERDQFLEDLEQTIRRAPKGSVAQVRAQALYARMKFGVSTPDEPESPATVEPATVPAASEAEPKFKVGDLVLQNGQKYRVTSVDANGKALTANEVE